MRIKLSPSRAITATEGMEAMATTGTVGSRTTIPRRAQAIAAMQATEAITVMQRAEETAATQRARVTAETQETEAITATPQATGIRATITITAAERAAPVELTGLTGTATPPVILRQTAVGPRMQIRVKVGHPDRETLLVPEEHRVRAIPRVRAARVDPRARAQGIHRRKAETPNPLNLQECPLFSMPSPTAFGLSRQLPSASSREP